MGTVFTERRLRIAHFSVRNAAQYVTKVVRGWAKILTAGQACMDGGFSSHYREPFEILRHHPERLLRSGWLLEQENADRCVIPDPIDYRGGPLRYTPPNDPEMQSVRALVGFLSDVCTRYGELTDALPVARAYSERIERRINRLI